MKIMKIFFFNEAKYESVPLKWDSSKREKFKFLITLYTTWNVDSYRLVS